MRLDVVSQERIDASIHVPDLLARLGLADETQEVFWVIAYDAEMKIRTIVEVGRGSYTAVPIHYPALHAAILASGADRFAIAHNHPSNNPRPTAKDRALTATIMEQANLLGLYFENHFIVTPSGKTTDFAAQGLMIPAPYHREPDGVAASTHTEGTNG